ncbi:MAG TPA: OmpA family protein [Kofleriaceae bacterium]|nr:OmpA family protein [Kofleriaceae bacterium]
MRRLIGLALLLVSLDGVAMAEPTSGVDSVMYRPSYDTNGIFALEGARLMPKRDLSLKLQLGYAQSPIDASVPGIGMAAGDFSKESILDYLITLDMTFGMTLTSRVSIGLDVGSYRTATGVGYGQRGRYTAGGIVSKPSTGLIALRPLSNIDQSANPDDPGAYLGDGRSGPLDARAGLKIALYEDPKIAAALVASVFLPFGDDYMLVGDRNVVYEPKLAFEMRPDRIHATRFLANLGARIRNRTILEGYDTADTMASSADAKVFLDVGSEMVAGVGGQYELTPRAVVGLEAQAFVPLPTSVGYGKCRRFNGFSCKTIDSGDYWGDAKAGDLSVLAMLGMLLRVSADVSANIMISSGPVGARGDDFRITTGLIWSPQPAGVAAPGRNDHDGDGIPDSVDACVDEAEDKDGFQDEDGCADADNDGDGIADGTDDCPNEPEDKDGFQDNDGCPERDNDADTVPDAADKCPNEAEDVDGFEDEDGCPDQDNDGDGFPDAKDKCPNDPETVNGFEDDDGCPDVRATTGPEERQDRIDLKGQQVTFDKQNKVTAAGKALLNQVAAIIKTRKLTIRVEVHVARGTKATSAAALNAQRPKDKQQAQKRAIEVLNYLVSQGVPANQLQAVGIGSDRPLDSAAPTDPINDRVDLIKAQQGGTP